MEASITSHFSTSETATQGTIGKDYRIKYSLIAFSGVISGNRAKKTMLKEDDLTLLDEAMKHAIPNLATRSKIGQYPRLYIRAEYVDNETILGDYRDYIKFKENVPSVRDINECSLAIDRLVELFKNNKDKIKNVHYFADEGLN